MDSIGKLVNDILKKRGILPLVRQQEMLVRWREVVGDDIAGHTEAVSVKKGVLWIRVKDSVWMHHLSMMKKQIMDKVNGYLKTDTVRDIYFFIGEVDSGRNRPAGQEDSPVKEAAPPLFPETELKNLLEKISDEEIKNIIKKILENN